MQRSKGNFSVIEILFFLFLSLCFLGISYTSIEAGFNEGGIAERSNGLFVLGIIILTIANSLFIKGQVSRRFDSIDAILWIYSTLFIISFLSVKSFSFTDIYDCISKILWVFCFNLGRKIGTLNAKKRDSFIMLFVIVVIIPILIFGFQKYQSTVLLFTDENRDVSFNIIAYFPFVLFIIKRKLFKTILVFVFFVIVIFSFKRSGILAVFMATLIFIVLSINSKTMKKYLFSWYALALLVGGFFLFNYLNESVGEYVRTRFELMSEDGGSNRNVIYSTLINAFWRADLISFFFGHGYRSTFDYVGVLAHNDLLQVFFDLGVVGGCLYLVFILSLFKNVFRHFKMRRSSNDYAAFSAAVAMLVMLTSFNCFIYSFSMLSPLMFCLGFGNESLRSVNRQLNL